MTHRSSPPSSTLALTERQRAMLKEMGIQLWGRSLTQTPAPVAQATESERARAQSLHTLNHSPLFVESIVSTSENTSKNHNNSSIETKNIPNTKDTWTKTIENTHKTTDSEVKGLWLSSLQHAQAMTQTLSDLSRTTYAGRLDYLLLTHTNTSAPLGNSASPLQNTPENLILRESSLKLLKNILIAAKLLPNTIDKSVKINQTSQEIKVDNEQSFHIYLSTSNLNCLIEQLRHWQPRIVVILGQSTWRALYHGLQPLLPKESLPLKPQEIYALNHWRLKNLPFALPQPHRTTTDAFEQDPTPSVSNLVLSYAPDMLIRHSAHKADAWQDWCFAVDLIKNS